MKVHYKQLGTGRPLILLHGFCETSEVWSSFAGPIAENFQVLIPDLPGFGQSAPIAGDFTIADVADTLLEWLQPWSTEKPVVIGHSLGGYVALAMAHKQIEAFAGIGLFHSTAYADNEERKQSRNKVIAFAEKHGVEAYTQSFVPGLFYRKDHPAIPLVQKIAAATLMETLEGYAVAMRDRPSSVGVMIAYNRPVLIIGGVHDTLITAAQLGEQATQTSHPSYYSLPDTAHMGMFENEETARKALVDFMNLTGGFVT